MVIESKDASGTTPVTAGRTARANFDSAKLIISLADTRANRAIKFDDSEASDQDIEAVGHADDNNAVVFSHEEEERLLYVGHFSNPRGIERRQADERDEEEGGGQGVTPGERPSLAPKATMNTQTPIANQALCRLAEEMKKSR